MPKYYDSEEEEEDEDDTLVVLGTPLPTYAKDEVPVRKPVSVQEQVVKDSEGRVRFHGAFTGGFSAGYFNSVSTKEGWVPKSFVSSRSQRADVNQKPEDYMDEEDFSEFGIAPRKLATTDKFSSSSVPSSSAPNKSSGAVDYLTSLVALKKLSIGLQLLRKMGWRENQGIGPRTNRKRRRNQPDNKSKKTYGCALPPPGFMQGSTEQSKMSTNDDESDDDDDDAEYLENVTFAPCDVCPITFKVKDNQHGLGYRPLDPRVALGHVLTQEVPVGNGGPAARPGSSKKGIRGQAFGVGAFEEEDCDIYGIDSMSNYDTEIGAAPQTEKNFSWTAPKHGVHETGRSTDIRAIGGSTMTSSIPGFHRAPVALKPRQSYPAPELPRGYRPFHTFVEHSVPHGGQGEKSGGGRKTKQTIFSRASELGETPNTRSVLELVSLEDRCRIEAAMMTAERLKSLEQKSSSTNFTTNSVIDAPHSSARQSTPISPIDFTPNSSKKHTPVSTIDVTPSSAVDFTPNFSKYFTPNSNIDVTPASDKNSNPTSTIDFTPNSSKYFTPNATIVSAAATSSTTGLSVQKSANNHNEAASINQHSLQQITPISQESNQFSQLAAMENLQEKFTSSGTDSESSRKEISSALNITSGFKPFAKDPEKQKRYEQFLECMKLKKEYIVEDTSMVREMTEWERGREREEFSRAAQLYRPLSFMMTSRFTTAVYDDDDVNNRVKKVEKSSQEKAADMKMFGKLSRETEEWHPDKLLCKRFNIANPYPDSNVVGLLTAKREKSSFFDFLSFPGQSTESPQEDKVKSSEASSSSGASGSTLQSIAKNSTKKAKPLAILSKVDLRPMASINRAEQTGSSNQSEEVGNAADDSTLAIESISASSGSWPHQTSGEPSKEALRPSLDLFKSIFVNSDNESYSDDESNSTISRNKLSPTLQSEQQQQQSGQLFQQNNPEQLSKTEPDSHSNVSLARNDRSMNREISDVPGASVKLEAEESDSDMKMYAGSAVIEKSSTGGRRKHKSKSKKKKKKQKHKSRKSKKTKKRVSSSSSCDADSESESEEDSRLETSANLDKKLLKRLKNLDEDQRMRAADFFR